MKQSSTRGGPAAASPPAAAVPAQRRKGERRPEPVLSEAYAHLSVDGLREYRRALSDEEHRVSYWRRILQARLDLVASGTTRKGVDHERLHAAAHHARASAPAAGRSARWCTATTASRRCRSSRSCGSARSTPRTTPARAAFEDDLRARRAASCRPTARRCTSASARRPASSSPATASRRTCA